MKLFKVTYQDEEATPIWCATRQEAEEECQYLVEDYDGDIEFEITEHEIGTTPDAIARFLNTHTN
jgi:hypothetical protein